MGQFHSHVVARFSRCYVWLTYNGGGLFRFNETYQIPIKVKVHYVF